MTVCSRALKDPHMQSNIFRRSASRQVVLGVRTAIVAAAVVSSIGACAATGEDCENSAARLSEELLSISEEDDGSLLQSAVLRPRSPASRPLSPAPNTRVLDVSGRKSTDQVSQPAALTANQSKHGDTNPGRSAKHKVGASTRRRRRSLGHHRSHSGLVFTQISSDVTRMQPSEEEISIDDESSMTYSEDDKSLEPAGLSNSLLDFVQIPWWWGFVGLIMAICLGYLIWNLRQWLAKYDIPLLTEEPESMCSEPEDEQDVSATSVGLCEQLEATFSGVSLVIPLQLRVDISTPHIVEFDIHRPCHAQPIHVSISCIPDGEIWAKIELSLHMPGSSHLVPIASCSLVDRATGVDTVNMKGVMQSWLALLLQEKSTRALSEVELHDRHLPAESDRSVNLQGAVEVLAHLGEHPLEHHALEIRDGHHNLIGTLEPGLAGHYALMQHCRPVVEIEAGPQSRSLLFSRQGDVIALAQSSGLAREDDDNLQSESPDADDYLQMDVYANACAAPDCSSWACAHPAVDVNREVPEVVVLLTCALAMVVFNLKL